MAPQPRVSVLMSVYNSELYLREAVESLLTQTMSDLEVIAIDDGSTDSSAMILNEMAAQDPRLRVISRENRGISQSINEAMELAQAPEFFARMDSDDVCLPDRFEKQLAIMEADPALVALGGQNMMIDMAGRDLKPSDLPLTHEEIEASHLKIPNHMAIGQPMAMIRRAALEKIGGYSHDYPAAEDMDLFLRLGEVGRLANLPDVVLRYRVHMNSIGHRRRAEQLDSAWRAARDAARRRGLPEREPLPEGMTGRDAHDVTGRMVMWGWWALNAGNLATARYYGVQALLASPMQRKPWKLLLVALRDTVKTRLRGGSPKTPRI